MMNLSDRQTIYILDIELTYIPGTQRRTKTSRISGCIHCTYLSFNSEGLLADPLLARANFNKAPNITRFDTDEPFPELAVAPEFEDLLRFI